jgi:hypothetical protein
MSNEKTPNSGCIMICRAGETEWKPFLQVYAHAFKPTEANADGCIKLSAITPKTYKNLKGEIQDCAPHVINPGDKISLKMDKYNAFLGVKATVDDEGNIILEPAGA